VEFSQTGSNILMLKNSKERANLILKSALSSKVKSWLNSKEYMYCFGVFCSADFVDFSMYFRCA
jgi:3-deoxy-D-arabino-heptulosonate 7-phosphate (DAHP) synthase